MAAMLMQPVVTPWVLTTALVNLDLKEMAKIALVSILIFFYILYKLYLAGPAQQHFEGGGGGGGGGGLKREQRGLVVRALDL